MSRIRFRVPAFIFLLLVGTLSSALATTSLFVTDAEQAELSTAVAIVRVGDSNVELDVEAQSLLTRTKLVVEEVLYGSAPAEVSIVQGGGTLNGRTIYIPGDAQFEAAERCVVFLRQVEGNWYLTAMEQSKYELSHHEKFGELMKRDLGDGIVTRNGRGQLVDYEAPIRPPIKRLRNFRALMLELQGQKGGSK